MTGMEATTTTAGTHSGTPSLTIGLIRETLNPVPDPTAAGIAVFGEFGYLAAMLDAVLMDYRPDEILDPREFVALVRDLLNYEGCEWRGLEWDDEGQDTLQMMADAIIDMDYEV